jgi:hypothetical protein
MRILLQVIGVVFGLAAPATGWAQARPNLVAVSIAGPSEGTQGETVQVDVVVRAEFQPTDPVDLVVWLTTGRDPDSGRERLRTALPSLAPGETYQSALSLSIPLDAEGVLRWALEVDETDEIDEANEFDNYVFGDELRVELRRADLRIERIQVSAARVAAGDAIDVTVNATNQGADPADGLLRVGLGTTAAVSAEDLRIGEAPVTVSPGNRVQVNLTATVPSDLPAGTYTPGVVFEPTNPGTEVDEVNNRLGLPGGLVVVQPFLELRTSSLPEAVVGFPYLALLTAAGGDGDYRFDQVGGSVPPGVSVDEGGVVFGQPLASGTFDFSVEVASDGRIARQDLRLVVRPVDEDLVIVNAELPTGRLLVAYDQQLVANGGERPYAWTVEGQLPPGLVISDSGRLQGAPSDIGRFEFDLTVTDRLGDTERVTTSIEVETSIAVLVDPDPLPVATAGRRYERQLLATGGMPPYEWSVVAGSQLPAGLTLSNAGLLSGTPGVTGSFIFQVEAEDASDPPLSDRSLVFLVIEDAATFDIQVPSQDPIPFRERFQRLFTAEGGTPPYRWTLVPGSAVPGNVTFGNGSDERADQGVLQGAAQEAGLFGMGVRVEDAVGRRREVEYGLVVDSTFVSGSGGCRDAGPAVGPWWWMGVAVLSGRWMWRRRRRTA